MAVPCTLNGLFLYATGEFLPVAKIAAMQKENPQALASCATHDLTYPYKLELYKLNKPDIVAIGSSRVMPFRESSFKAKFLNMSRAMNSIDQGYFLVKEILQIHPPKVVIMGLDYWWFVGPVQNLAYYNPPRDQNNLSLKLLLEPYIWLYQKKITWNYYWHHLFKVFSKQIPIGVNAQVKGDGFASDGSFYHMSTLTGTHPTADANFKLTLMQIAQGQGQFQHNQKIEPVYIDRLQQILAALDKAGVKTYLFIPPVAPAAIQAMAERSTQYQYIQELKIQLQAKGIHIYDFHDPITLPTDDCEFIDGYHGGDVVYLKILKKIAEDDPSQLLVQYLMIPELDRYQHFAFFPHPNKAVVAEVDFLQLGCKKS